MIRIGVPIEWHAAKIYTRVMFDKLYGELYASGAFTASPVGGDGYTYCVRQVIWSDDHLERDEENIVEVNAEGTKLTATAICTNTLECHVDTSLR